MTNTIFSAYQSQDAEALAEALLPFICKMADRTIAGIGLEPDPDLRQEAISAGCLVLVRKMGRILEDEFQDGRGIATVLWRPVKKAMSLAIHRSAPIPQPSPETRRKRVKRGEPAWKSWEPRQRVPVQGDWEHGRRRPDRRENVDERFHARDPRRAERYFEFLDRVRDEALKRADEREWWALLCCMYDPDSSTSDSRPVLAEVARKMGMRRRTLVDRLRKLGERIASEADGDFRDEGEEFLGRFWTDAAKRGGAR
jgi:hypothetical protein